MSDIFAPTCPRHVVVLAHPDPHSFNASAAEVYCETVRACGQDAVLRDLYVIGFDPLLKDIERPRARSRPLSRDVSEEIATIEGADMYALVYPIWFAMPPAMMKGYIDRVLGAAVTAHEIEARAGRGVLSGRHMLSITTSGAREAWLDEQGQVESLRTIFSRYLFHAFSMKSCEHLHLGAIVEGSSKRFIDQRLEEVRQRARAICATLSAQRYAASEPPSIADGS